MESMVKKLKHKFKYEYYRKKKEEKRFLENGSIFLRDLIADCNGKTIPIRRFSSSQIRKATSNFAHSFLIKLDDDEWYKGIIEDKPYLIKKFSKYDLYKEYAFNDIVLSARMSNHNNFLKLLGCCFEFSVPVVLFEYDEYSIVERDGHIMVNGEKSILPWNVRLKIAKEIAIAVTYLHMAFPRITIHRDIKPTNIFLDKNWKAKLIDFRFSVTLPEGKSRSEDETVIGTYGYIDPKYIMRGVISEYTDVFSFGICLLIFLTRKPAYDRNHLNDSVNVLYENGKLDEIIDPMIAKDITSSQRLQMEAFVVLALRCCKESEEERPKMIQVAKELKRIELIELSLDETSVVAFPKNEVLEDEPCIFKSTRKLKLD